MDTMALVATICLIFSTAKMKKPSFRYRKHAVDRRTVFLPQDHAQE